MLPLGLELINHFSSSMKDPKLSFIEFTWAIFYRQYFGAKIWPWLRQNQVSPIMGVTFLMCSRSHLKPDIGRRGFERSTLKFSITRYKTWCRCLQITNDDLFHVPGCQFPSEWEGIWFQSTVRPYLTIDSRQMSTKGSCVASAGEKYILARLINTAYFVL